MSYREYNLDDDDLMWKTVILTIIACIGLIYVGYKIGESDSELMLEACKRANNVYKCELQAVPKEIR